MKKRCKNCEHNCEEDYCFRCKPRSPLPKIARKSIKDKLVEVVEESGKMVSFFMNIWSKNSHTCENCGKYLGEEPRSYMFDHLLEKSKYPHLAYEEENICILCLECHDNKTRSFLSDYIKNRIKIVREKFGI